MPSLNLQRGPRILHADNTKPIPTMTTAQKALIDKLDDIIDKLSEITTLLEASFDTHPELPLDTTNQP